MTECPDEWELVAFFGTEPTLKHEDLQWPYGEHTWTLERDGRVLTVSINGSYGDVDLKWGEVDEAGFSLSVRRVRALRIERERAGSSLVAYFSDSLPVPAMRLRVDPVVRLVWGLEGQ